MGRTRARRRARPVSPPQFGLRFTDIFLDNERSGSYIATYYFTFLWIPILPISRYRVISNGNSYRFLGKAPLRTFDKCHLAVSLGLIALVLINML